MTIPVDEAALKKLAEKLAKLRVNGVSDSSIKTIGGLTDVEWHELQDTEQYKEAFDKAKATAEIMPVEVDISIKTLEKQALAATIRNVTSGMATPEYVLDALKYATKVRMEEAKQEQERKTQFTANTQIVINMSDLLKKAIEVQPVSERIIEFAGDSKSVVNGLDTDRLMAAALGRPQDHGGASASSNGSNSSNSSNGMQANSPYPPAHINSYNPSARAKMPPVPMKEEPLVITEEDLKGLDEMEDVLMRPEVEGE